MNQPPTLKLVPTKQEEIEFLQQISDTLPQASYLKHLFTSQLVLWVADRIQRDLPPDIIAEYTADIARVMRQLADRREQIVRLQRLYDNNINQLLRKIRYLKEEIEDGNAAKDVGEESNTEEKQGESI